MGDAADDAERVLRNAHEHQPEGVLEAPLGVGDVGHVGDEREEEGTSARPKADWPAEPPRLTPDELNKLAIDRGFRSSWCSTFPEKKKGLPLIDRGPALCQSSYIAPQASKYEAGDLVEAKSAALTGV